MVVVCKVWQQSTWIRGQYVNVTSNELEVVLVTDFSSTSKRIDYLASTWRLLCTAAKRRPIWLQRGDVFMPKWTPFLLRNEDTIGNEFVTNSTSTWRLPKWSHERKTDNLANWRHMYLIGNPKDAFSAMILRQTIHFSQLKYISNFEPIFSFFSLWTLNKEEENGRLVYTNK